MGPVHLMPFRICPHSAGERNPQAAEAAFVRLLERAAAQGGEQLWGHALVEPIRQRQQSGQPTWLSASFKLLLQQDCAHL